MGDSTLGIDPTYFRRDSDKAYYTTLVMLRKDKQMRRLSVTHLRLIGFEIKELRATMQPTIVRFLRTRCGSCFRDFKSTSNCIPNNSAPFIVWHFIARRGCSVNGIAMQGRVTLSHPQSFRSSTRRLFLIVDSEVLAVTHERPLSSLHFPDCDECPFHSPLTDAV